MFFADFKKVLPYAIIVFLGYVGFSMPLPLLPEMFLDPEKSLVAVYPEKIKTFLLGLILSAYPLGQLVGSPILGKCSDRWGRKKIILISLTGCFLGYIFTGAAIERHSILSIFIGLLFCGLCEGNIAIAQSVVADLAFQDSEKKTVYFGWLNLFVCGAYIIGPILGGQLSDSSIASWFTFSTPFWIAAFLTLLGSGVIFYFSEETRVRNFKEDNLGYWKSFKRGIEQKGLRKMYVVNFFLALGYFSYFRFLPVYLQDTFSFSSSRLGYLMAYGSISFALSAFLFLKLIANNMKPQKAIALFAFFLALSFFLVLWPDQPWSIYFTSIPVNICLAIVMPYSSVLISNASSMAFQGQALGTLTSIQVFAEVLTGIGGGILAGYFISLPIIIGACMLFVASLFLFDFGRQKKDYEDSIDT